MLWRGGGGGWNIERFEMRGRESVRGRESEGGSQREGVRGRESEGRNQVEWREG